MKKNRRSNVINVTDLTDLYYKRFDSPVRVFVENGDVDQIYLSPGILDRENISEIHIRHPGLYASSEDGKMIFRLRKYERVLVLYLGNENDVEIPENVTCIGSNAFKGEKLNSVKIPDSVTYIESWAFGNHSPEEISLPASVLYTGSGSLCTSTIIHVHGQIYRLLDAVMVANPREGMSVNFCVEYDNRWHILPRNISLSDKKQAEEVIFNKNCEEGVYNHFSFGNFLFNQLASAYEIFIKRHDAETKNFLRTNISTLCRLVCREGEEKLVGFLEEFRQYDMFDCEALTYMMENVDQRWVHARACLLELMHNDCGFPEAEFAI